jgi:tetratricopeptide (TPR) repeat protein
MNLTVKFIYTIDNEVVTRNIEQGDKYRNHQQYQKAIEFYREALENDPYNLDAYYGIGYSNLKMGLHTHAIESFVVAVKIDPCDPESHYNLGIVYFLMKEKVPAFEQYKILKILDNDYATRLLMYIDCLRLQER